MGFHLHFTKSFRYLKCFNKPHQKISFHRMGFLALQRIQSLQNSRNIRDRKPSKLGTEKILWWALASSEWLLMSWRCEWMFRTTFGPHVRYSPGCRGITNNQNFMHYDFQNYHTFGSSLIPQHWLINDFCWMHIYHICLHLSFDWCVSDIISITSNFPALLYVFIYWFYLSVFVCNYVFMLRILGF